MKKTDIKTEQLILEAAKKVFIRKGMDGARMQEIADEAQITKHSCITIIEVSNSFLRLFLYMLSLPLLLNSMQF